MNWKRAGAVGLFVLFGLLTANLGKLRAELADLTSGSELERARLQQEKAALERRLADSSTRLEGLQGDLAGLREALSASEAAREEARRRTERELQSLGDLRSLGPVLETRMAGWERRLQDSAGQTLELRNDLKTLRGAMAAPRTDVEKLYTELLHPSVQVNARDAVGGGTLFHSEPAGPDRWRVHILTAYHVVQKSIPTRGRAGDPIEARLYRADGSVLGNFETELVSYSQTKDIALLRVVTPEPPATLARLADRAFLRAIRIFTPVYAVGCPLGHDPIPSIGEISSLKKQVAGENFWMVNAPTIFGNSGGGIFHRDTHQMIGISAMICTYDNLVSTPVPHLSIVVSLETVYDWLDAQGLKHLYEPRLSQAPR